MWFRIFRYGELMFVWEVKDMQIQKNQPNNNNNKKY